MTPSFGLTKGLRRLASSRASESVQRLFHIENAITTAADLKYDQDTVQNTMASRCERQSVYLSVCLSVFCTDTRCSHLDWPCLQ
jgi:hypothetical protein